MEQQQPKFPFNISFPVVPVLIPALVHFTLVSFALLGGGGNSFFYSHIILVLVGFWSALDKEGWHPVVSFLVVLVVSAITDIIYLGITFEALNIRNDINRFALAMIIINLLGKPVTLLLSILAIFFRRKSFMHDTGPQNYGQTGDPEAPPPDYQPPHY